MHLTSPVFEEGTIIPKKYGMEFENVNPPLKIADAPAGTISFALVMDDPDVPSTAPVPVWDHWVVFNIPSNTVEIPEGWKPTGAAAGLTPEGVSGAGTRGELRYMGPRPPDREHRYFFKLYALDVTLELPEGATKQQVLDAAEGHVLASAELMGRFAPG